MDTLKDTFSISDTAVAQEVGDELIVLDMATERYLAVDKVGGRIWGLLAEGRTIDSVVSEMTMFYGVDRDRIERDVSLFVTELQDLGLGRLSSSGQGRP